MPARFKGQTYGLPVGIQNPNPPPIIAQRAPTSADLGYLQGQVWIDTVGNASYTFLETVNNLASWAQSSLLMGQAVLVAGTVTVANTSIDATDKIILSRSAISGSTALGMLTYSITPLTSFTITAVQTAAPAVTEANDTSTIQYLIVRQV